MFLKYLPLLLVFFSACRKELPEHEKSDAVFYVDGILAEKKISLKAGDDKIYMLPGYSDDVLGIRSYNGVIGNLNCVSAGNCPGSFQFMIREREKNQNGRLTVDKSVAVKMYAFRGPATYLFTSYKATFKSNSIPLGVSHFWSFGDGVTSTEINPVHYYLSESDSIVSPTLLVESGSGCRSSISYETRFNSLCDVDFTPSFNNGRLSWSSAPNSGRNELWDFTNGYMPLGSSNLPPTDSVFTACVQSTDTISGCVSYKCKNIILDTNVVGCVANYDVIKEKVLTKDVRDYQEVTVKWEDLDGKTFSSDRYDQPFSSQFEIIEIADYTTDINGRPTKKLTVAFSLRLYGDSEADYVDFTSDKSVIAISYQ